MKKEALIKEYENNGLTITDFHLGLRLAKPIFINTIVAGLMFMAYLVFGTTLYEIFTQTNQEVQINLAIFTILIVLFLRYLTKATAYLYVLICLVLLPVIALDIEHSRDFDFIFNDRKVLGIFLGLFVLALISTLIVYRTNRNITIKDGLISIPASDVEQSFLAFIILKPFWGLFYRRKIPLEDIVSVKNDGYGSKKKDIYPVTITDKKASNRLIFTSRQKRDEFRTKIAIILGLRDSGGYSFGESE